MSDLPEAVWDGVPRMKAERDALARRVDELEAEKARWLDEREHMIRHMRWLNDHFTSRPRR